MCQLSASALLQGGFYYSMLDHMGHNPFEMRTAGVVRAHTCPAGHLPACWLLTHKQVRSHCALCCRCTQHAPRAEQLLISRVQDHTAVTAYADMLAAVKAYYGLEDKGLHQPLKVLRIAAGFACAEHGETCPTGLPGYATRRQARGASCDAGRDLSAQGRGQRSHAQTQQRPAARPGAG